MLLESLIIETANSFFLTLEQIYASDLGVFILIKDANRNRSKYTENIANSVQLQFPIGTKTALLTSGHWLTMRGPLNYDTSV